MECNTECTPLLVSPYIAVGHVAVTGGLTYQLHALNVNSIFKGNKMLFISGFINKSVTYRHKEKKLAYWFTNFGVSEFFGLLIFNRSRF